MKPEEREAYLKENPDSPVNPERPSKGCLPSPSCLKGLREEIEAERQRQAAQAALGGWQTKPLPLYPPGPMLQPPGIHPSMAPTQQPQLPAQGPSPREPSSLFYLFYPPSHLPPPLGWYGNSPLPAHAAPHGVHTMTQIIITNILARPYSHGSMGCLLNPILLGPALDPYIIEITSNRQLNNCGDALPSNYPV